MATMHNSSSPNARAKAVGLLLVQGIVSAGAYWWLLTQALRIAGCGDRCNYDSVSGAYLAQIWVSIGLFLAAIAAIVLLSVRGKESWWAPVIGVGGVIVTTAITTVIVLTGTAP